MPRRRLVLFDIDGTLLLTAGAGRRAIAAAMAEIIGTEAAFEGVRFDGKTDPQIVSELLHAAGDPDPRDAARINAVCDRYADLLETELQRATARVTLMPGVLELLDRLEREPRAVLGLLTGNLARGAALKLRAGGIDPERFAVGAYGSDSPHRPALPSIAASRAKPLLGRVPRGHEVVIIGDTPADVSCGVSVGARAVAVATGGYTLDELTACGPHAAFADLADTDAVLAAILD
jgi:phosphoglycolate phosphatase-like HAD superfamily hydrolase